MTVVFRVVKTKNYTMMSNQHLKDKRLTLKAKGLIDVYKRQRQGRDRIALEHVNADHVHREAVDFRRHDHVAARAVIAAEYGVCLLYTSRNSEWKYPRPDRYCRPPRGREPGWAFRICCPGSPWC